MFREYDIADKLRKAGAVGIMPTDTLYGLVAQAADRGAVARLYELKNRQGKPGTIVAADIEQLVGLGIKRRYLKAVEQFWPGATSVIIPSAGPELAYLHLGQQSLALRIPGDLEFRKLLGQTGPLLTSSANQPGRPPASTIVEAKDYFGGQVDFYIDGGDLSGRKPSTLIRVIDDAIEVLRQGAVTIGQKE